MEIGRRVRSTVPISPVWRRLRLDPGRVRVAPGNRLDILLQVGHNRLNEPARPSRAIASTRRMPMGAAGTAVIGDNVTLGDSCQVGDGCVIEDDVVIGDECRISHNVVVHAGSRIGNGVRIDPLTVIGKQRMRAKRSILQDGDELPPAEVGDECMIGAHVTVYHGAHLGPNVLVADLATVREQVEVGEYTIVGRNVTVENRVTVSRKCKLETNCYITAYSTIEDFCFIAPNVTTSNDNYVGRTEERFEHFKGVTVRRGGRIGAGATVLPGIVIGEDSLVGAGAVVTRDVPDHTVVVGVPARWFAPVPHEQTLEQQGWE